LEVRAEVRGILCNPNCLFEANFVPLKTFAQFLEAQAGWHPRTAYLAALQEWLPLFTADGRFSLELHDLELLGDMFYLPFECGQRMHGLLENLSWLLRTPPATWGERLGNYSRACDQIDQLTGRAAFIRNRELYFALFPSLSRLKTELAYVRACLEARQADSNYAPGSTIPEFPSEIFRGGLVGTLQRLLPTIGSGGV
jgi:protein O-GlcNAcase/histone acetyltransferase